MFIKTAKFGIRWDMEWKRISRTSKNQLVLKIQVLSWMYLLVLTFCGILTVVWISADIAWKE